MPGCEFNVGVGLQAGATGETRVASFWPDVPRAVLASARDAAGLATIQSPDFSLCTVLSLQRKLAIADEFESVCSRMLCMCSVRYNNLAPYHRT